MANVLIALAPATVFSVIIYGIYALVNIVVALAAAELSELAFRKLVHREARNGDLSAAVTGLLLALVIPPTTPWWMTLLGSVFAIVVVKEFFGGLGANVFNPALAGRAFLLMSFPAALTTWLKPNGGFMESMAADASTGATVLGGLKESLTSGADAVGGASLHFFTDGGMLAAQQQGYTSYGSFLQALFLGNQGGSAGETSALLILAGFVYLLVTKTIDWKTPISMLAAAFLMSLALGMDPLVGLLSGGLLFGAVFMTTDYVTGPVTSMGRVVFGVGCGIITVLIRKFGSYPEGVCYSILIMNCVTPFLDRLIQKKYGFVKPVKAKEEKK
jgi:electron transport complex protein RnfD